MCPARSVISTGVAPADEPRVGIAMRLVQIPLWWRNASEIAADVLEGVFCVKGRFSAQQVGRFVRPRAAERAAPSEPLAQPRS